MFRVLLAALVLLTGCPPRHEYNDQRGLAGQLEREVIALQQKNRILEEMNKTCSEGGPPDKLYSELVQIFSGSELDLSRSGVVSTVTIPGNHLYAEGRMELRMEAKRTLDLLGMALSGHPKHTIIVEGHTSDRTMTSELRKIYRDDWGLSHARARLFVTAMVREYHIGPERFTIAARGEYDPVASNDTTSGQGRNERLTLYIYPPGAR